MNSYMSSTLLHTHTTNHCIIFSTSVCLTFANTLHFTSVWALGGEGWLKDVYAPVSSLMNKTQKMKSKSQNTQKKKKSRFQPTLLPLLTSGLVHLFLIFSAIS